MARFLVILFAAAVLAAGKLSHAAPSTAEVFWRAVLPDSPLPDAILRLLHRPDTNVVSKSEADGAAAQNSVPFNYQDYRGSSSSSSPAKGRDFGYDDYRRDSTKRVAAATRAAEPSPFNYGYQGSDKRRGSTAGEAALLRAAEFEYEEYDGAGERRGALAGDADPYGYDYKVPSSTGAAVAATSTARGGGGAPTTTVFFHEEAVRVGERLPFKFPAAKTAALGLLPRRVADAIPFSTPALPGVLALLDVAPGSAQAARMRETLRTCETPTLAGEAKFCAASLEALVEGSMAALGTRDVRAITSTLPRAGAPLQTYTVRAVRRVQGSSFVACHDQAYPYTVYRCHTTGPARAYMVEMEGARGGGAVTVATVCHTDTSRWNPEHVSFKLLGTKPGGATVCHLMPYGHIIWAKNVKRSPV